jgi:protocatechuate 3,4-dioxygenase beta subunit
MQPNPKQCSNTACSATNVRSTTKRQPTNGGWLAPTAAPLATTAPATTAPIAVPACVVRPEQAAGPFFVDDKLNRVDIRSDPRSGNVKDGLPLALTINVAQISGSGCAPLSNASVDIWHCDAQGSYSDVNDGRSSTVGQQFLRGFQTTDANGVARFTTIYPGWYPGRTVHIHIKIRATTPAGQSYDFTSQLYFDDTITDTVYAQAPYTARGQRTTRNPADGIYRRGGDQLLLTLTPASQGYNAIFDVGLDLS